MDIIYVNIKIINIFIIGIDNGNNERTLSIIKNILTSLNYVIKELVYLVIL